RDLTLLQPFGAGAELDRVAAPLRQVGEDLGQRRVLVAQAEARGLQRVGGFDAALDHRQQLGGAAADLGVGVFAGGAQRGQGGAALRVQLAGGVLALPELVAAEARDEGGETFGGGRRGVGVQLRGGQEQTSGEQQRNARSHGGCSP